MEQYLLYALLLIGGGLVMLGAEFVATTGGLFVVLGVTAIFAGVGVIWRHGSTTEAAVALIGLCVLIPVAGSSLFALWKRMTIIPGVHSESAAATLADVAEEAGVGRLVGRYGKTLTPMRPSGSVDFEGRRYDALSEGLPIAGGAWVKCVAVRAGRVVVREADAPSDFDAASLEDEPPA